MIKTFICTLLFFVTFGSLHAQQVAKEILPTLRVKIISEHNRNYQDIANFEQTIKHEIEILLVNKKSVVFESEYCNCQADQVNLLLNKAFEDRSTDIVLAVGPLASALLANRSTYSKPSIASLIIDRVSQNVPFTKDRTSGKKNFTYIQSPFSFEKDLNLLHDIFPFKNIGVIMKSSTEKIFPKFEDLFNLSTTRLNSQFTPINLNTKAQAILDQIPEDVDAVYLLPFFNNFSDEQYNILFEGLAERQLPSAALMGESIVEKGAMVGYQTSPNLSKIPRRIAMNIYKISQGTDPADLPVEINTYSDNVVINMHTARQVGSYPNWDIMTEAILLNANTTKTGRSLSLQSTIMESLRQNLDLKIAKIDPLLASKDVQLAQSELRPQLDASTSMFVLDKNTSDNSFGTRGRLNWVAGATLSQLVFAEPALANVAIQKLLQKGEEAGMQTTQLDIVVKTVESYLQVLQAHAYMDIQASNISVTKSNLDISQAKDSVGYSGASDLNRWISQLALAKIDFNDAQTQFRQAKYALNQTLNQPINEAFNIEEVAIDDQLLLATDERLINKINNERDLDKLADFFVEEALINLPELKGISYALDAQDRLLTSRKRAFYLPVLAVSGDLNYNLKMWDAKESPIGGTSDNNASWNVGLGLQFPILQGNSRRYNQQKSELSILQLKDQKANIKNQLELRVRVNLQSAVASYFEVQRFREASKAAADNFDIVQDSYTQGVTSITNLIDAQNAKIQTALGLANAGYQFILDFFEVERAIGYYYNLKTPAEQNAFFERLEAFIIKQ